MENDIFFAPCGGDRGFTFKCVLYCRKWIKVPMFFNIYRTRQSTSRQPPTLEGIAKVACGFSSFADTFEKLMDDFSFFKENPIYKHLVIDYQIRQWDWMATAYQYPSSQALNPKFVNAVDEQIKKEFGKHSRYVQWLLHRYHLTYRRTLELTEHIRQLEAQKK